MSDEKLDRIELTLRRVFIIIFLLLIVYLILFKWIGIGKNKNIQTNSQTTMIENTNTTTDDTEKDSKKIDIKDNQKDTGIMISKLNNIKNSHGMQKFNIAMKNNSKTSKDTKNKNGNSKKNNKNTSIDEKINHNTENYESVNESNNEIINLGSNYISSGNEIYYKGKIVQFINANEFTVLDKKTTKEINGTLINSDNLLIAFQDYETRLAMMNTIDDIITNEKNVTSTLKDSSENGMYKIKADYEDLSQYNRSNQKGVLTPEQRAKFAIIYLYVKIAKNAKGTVYMEQALNELKEFIENFDPNKLKAEVTDKNFKIKGDIGMDKHCIFLDGELYACFLDEIF